MRRPQRVQSRSASADRRAPPSPPITNVAQTITTRLSAPTAAIAPISREHADRDHRGARRAPLPDRRLEQRQAGEEQRRPAEHRQRRERRRGASSGLSIVRLDRDRDDDHAGDHHRVGVGVAGPPDAGRDRRGRRASPPRRARRTAGSTIAHRHAQIRKPTTNAASTLGEPCCPENVSPTRSTDSPSAIISTSWQRSARWPPASVQSSIGVAPDARQPESRGPAPPGRPRARTSHSHQPQITVHERADDPDHARDHDHASSCGSCDAFGRRAGERPDHEPRADHLERDVGERERQPACRRTRPGSRPTSPG